MFKDNRPLTFINCKIKEKSYVTFDIKYRDECAGVIISELCLVLRCESKIVKLPSWPGQNKGNCFNITCKRKHCPSVAFTLLLPARFLARNLWRDFLNHRVKTTFRHELKQKKQTNMNDELYFGAIY